MRPPFAVLVAGLLVVAAFVGGPLASPSPAAAATLAATTTCANSVDNAGGLGVICEVTIVNTITASGGSATVTVRECHGAAGDPEAACVVDTQVLTEPVTSVDQCNAAVNGGGGTLRCSVHVTNNFEMDPSAVDASVDQCVGSGDGLTVGCDPFPATTTGAAITQCNGSANGGTLVELTCTASGTMSGDLAVTINQCNGSGNGGGALVICTADVESLFAPASPPPSTSPAASRVLSSPPDTDTEPTQSTSGSGGASLAVLLAIALAATIVVSLGSRRTRRG